VTEQHPNAQTIRELGEYWQAVHGKERAKVPSGGARWKVIAKALKDFNPAEIRQAIEGCYRSDWHMRRGQHASRKGKVENDLTLILRDETTIERFIGICREREGTERPPEARSGSCPACRARKEALDTSTTLSKEQRAELLVRSILLSNAVPFAPAVKVPQRHSHKSALIKAHYRDGTIDRDHPRDPFDAFTTHLERSGFQVRYHGVRRATAQCPGHEDSEPSLDIKQGDDWVLTVCRSHQCSTETICAAVDWPIRWLALNPQP
jgi:hypothetical protein